MEGVFSGLMITHKGASPSRMFTAFGGPSMDALPPSLHALGETLEKAVTVWKASR